MVMVLHEENVAMCDETNNCVKGSVDGVSGADIIVVDCTV